MQRVIISILIFLTPLYVNGQLYTMSDYYVQDALAINPSYAGSQDALSISVFDRFSWIGFEGSPKTMSLSIHAPMDNERVGLGLFLVNDMIGVTSETRIVGNYAFRMNVGYGKLAFGLGAGIILQKINWTKLAAQDAGDELLADNSASGVMPNFSLGVYYSTSKYFVGLSLPMFLSREFDAGKGRYAVKNNISEYNYFFNAGYDLDLDRNFRLLPAILVKYHKGDAMQIDIGSRVMFKNRFSLGTFYRSKNIMVGTIQCKVNDQLRFAYSYDFMVGNRIQYKYNSHEIMLNYIFDYHTNVTGPRQF